MARGIIRGVINKSDLLVTSDRDLYQGWWCLTGNTEHAASLLERTRTDKNVPPSRRMTQRDVL